MEPDNVVQFPVSEPCGAEPGCCGVADCGDACSDCSEGLLAGTPEDAEPLPEPEPGPGVAEVAALYQQEQPEDMVQFLSAKVGELVLQNMRLQGAMNGLIDQFNRLGKRHNELETGFAFMSRDVVKNTQAMKNLDERIKKAMQSGKPVIYLPGDLPGVVRG